MNKFDGVPWIKLEWFNFSLIQFSFYSYLAGFGVSPVGRNFDHGFSTLP